MEPNQTILILEDDPSLRQLLDTAFTHAGYVVTATADGVSGLTLAQMGGFTAILLDLRMPRMDGIGFLKSLQNTPPQVPNGPVIVFTNIADEAIKKEALEAGATAYFNKDEENFTKLPQKLETLLHQSELL